MAKKITLDQLSDWVEELMIEEEKETERAIRLATEATKRKAVSDVSSKSPVGPRKSVKKYSESWGTRTEKGRLFNHVIIHNQQYQLTHLLEKGHFIFNQYGGAYGRTRAIPHIGPVQDDVDKNYVEELIKRLEKI